MPVPQIIGLIGLGLVAGFSSGILGIGAMQKRVVVIDDAIAIRPMIYMSFVFDHRILDGASADLFLAKVKEILENWA